MAVSSTKQKVLCVGENKIGIENYPHLSTDEKIRTNFILGAFFYFQTWLKQKDTEMRKQTHRQKQQ